MIITGLAQRVVFRRERCGNGSGVYLHYGDPASDQGSRHDTHYSTLTWSWVDVSADGHTRALLAPGQAVQRCHVRAIRRDSWDETGAVNGGVIARYVRTSTGGQRCTAGCLGSTTTTTTVTTRDGRPLPAAVISGRQHAVWSGDPETCGPAAATSGAGRDRGRVVDIDGGAERVGALDVEGFTVHVSEVVPRGANGATPPRSTHGLPPPKGFWAVGVSSSAS